MTFVRGQAADPLLERPCAVELPQPDRVVLGPREEDGPILRCILADDVEADNDICVTLVQLNLPALHVEQLQCLAI